jgi:hypothetical protein
MDLSSFTVELACNAETIRSLVENVSVERARWKPGPDQWSILEVVNHLRDEEIEDFRTHLDLILHRPQEPWPRIDPAGWVTQRRYNEREIGPSLDAFLVARRESLSWLQDLANPDWNASYAAPFGVLTAGDMFVSWATHDLLHLRQLVELHYAHTAFVAAPYQVAYAGPW